MLPEFLEKYLNSPSGRDQAYSLTQGMANRNLVLKDLKQIKIPFLPLSEQRRIAAILNEQMEAAERLRGDLEKQLHEINSLPAALLRRVFNGEL